ncbi:hypothetical protein GDO78_016392 [Eleutherodactylus coqui]|uniref:SIN3-HDAC complex-associated factor n=1 Tax=Eleutherodactylus coqui TaxID=57060 RepID=A0A8J6EAJ9_ELECQ|nr:hypothetical protein GDO78_016392 [Eleutherodactylus coqui]
MIGFYKPKTYRSSRGCCICKAKSSSSRFTDSKRYEGDFQDCFGLREMRTGDICNACVLLVKRWKKLPSGSKKNWNHVVDARGGPNLKTLRLRPKRIRSLAARRMKNRQVLKMKKSLCKQKVCCGIIYKGRYGEILIDAQQYKPCCSNKKTEENDTRL